MASEAEIRADERAKVMAEVRQAIDENTYECDEGDYVDLTDLLHDLGFERSDDTGDDEPEEPQGNTGVAYA